MLRADPHFSIGHHVPLLLVFPIKIVETQVKLRTKLRCIDLTVFALKDIVGHSVVFAEVIVVAWIEAIVAPVSWLSPRRI